MNLGCKKTGYMYLQQASTQAFDRRDKKVGGREIDKSEVVCVVVEGGVYVPRVSFFKLAALAYRSGRV